MTFMATEPNTRLGVDPIPRVPMTMLSQSPPLGAPYDRLGNWAGLDVSIMSTPGLLQQRLRAPKHHPALQLLLATDILGLQTPPLRKGHGDLNVEQAYVQRSRLAQRTCHMLQGSLRPFRSVIVTSRRFAS